MQCVTRCPFLAQRRFSPVDRSCLIKPPWPRSRRWPCDQRSPWLLLSFVCSDLHRLGFFYSIDTSVPTFHSSTTPHIPRRSIALTKCLLQGHIENRPPWKSHSPSTLNWPRRLSDPSRPRPQFQPPRPSPHTHLQTAPSPPSPRTPPHLQPRPMHGQRFRLRPVAMDIYAPLEPSLPSQLAIETVS